MYDRLGYYLLAKLADIVICHSQWSQTKINIKYHINKKIVLMYHGNYKQYFPKPASRKEVYKALGLQADKPLVCCLGNIRQYKGIEDAVTVIKNLHGEVQLVIAGKPHGFDSIGDLKNNIKNIDYIVLIDRKISNQEFSNILSSSEALLLPYKKVTTSGAMLAAWSLGTGVIASDFEYFKEIGKNSSDAIVFFKKNDNKDFTQTILSYLKRDKKQRYEAAMYLSTLYSWENSIRMLLNQLSAL